MNGLCLFSIDRKAFQIAVALAVLFVFLVGGANALAQPTVRCVPKTTLNASCTAGTTYATISLAVGAAAAGDIIVVGPGKYNESVNITIPLSLFGAQAGVDARVGRTYQHLESVVDATGKSGPAFLVNLSETYKYSPVVIDGFTIQGGTAGSYVAGIYVTYYYSAPVQILDNIIRNNAVGAYLHGAYGTVVKHNLIQSNNSGTADSEDIEVAGTAGYGIVLYYPYQLTITGGGGTCTLGTVCN